MPQSEGDRLEVDELPAHRRPPSFRAHTQLDPSFEISIHGSLDWGLGRRSDVQGYAECNRIDSPVMTMLETLLDHEIGHELHCPRERGYARRMTRAVESQLADERERRPVPAGLGPWLTNLVADLIVNANEAEYKHGPSFVQGMALLWYDQAHAPARTTALKRAWARVRAPRLSPLMQAFVLAHVHLAPNGATVRNLLGGALRDPRFRRKRDSTDEIAQRIAQLLRDPATRRDPGEWERLSRQIVALLAPLFPDGVPDAETSTRSPLFEGNDAEGSGDPGANEEIGPAGPGGERETVGGDGDSEPGSRDGETNEATGGEADGEGEADAAGPFSAGQTSGIGPPGLGLGGRPVPDGAADLDQYYAELAGKAPIELRTGPDPNPSIATSVAPFRLDERLADLHPIDSVLIAIDDSGSMSAGSGGGIGRSFGMPYHYALLAVYTVANWLKDAPDPRQVNVVTFSSTTRATGWYAAANVRKALRHVFSPEGGGTRLDLDRLEEQLPPGRHAVVFIVSDGEVGDADAIGEFFARDDVAARCTPALVEIQPGHTSPLARVFQRRGFRNVQLDRSDAIVDEIAVTVSEVLGQ